MPKKTVTKPKTRLMSGKGSKPKTKVAKSRKGKKGR